MLKFDSFTGINNVIPPERLFDPDPRVPSALAEAVNVDIGLSGEIRRRRGYAQASGLCHKNLHQADGFMLATVNGDLTAIDGEARAVVYPSLGTGRVWYCNLPDGRTTFSNGLICGITDGATATDWGVKTPDGLGTLMAISGGLNPGDYRYALTYVRLSDGREGGAAVSTPAPIPDGGVFLSGLPVLAGHKINVYLSSHNGGEMYLAGSTTNGVFSYIGTNDALVLPCRTNHLSPAPAGTVAAFWRGRVLVAVGSVLYASLTNNYELFDLRRDFKQMIGTITAIVPVDDGLYVGTTRGLAFLSGGEWDKLQYRQVSDGPVVLGSGVPVRGELLKQAEGAGLGSAAVFIADGVLVAAFSGGTVVRLTEGRYRTDVTEVAATFRVVDGIPQYIAIQQ